MKEEKLRHLLRHNRCRGEQLTHGPWTLLLDCLSAKERKAVDVVMRGHMKYFTDAEFMLALRKAWGTDDNWNNASG